MTWDGVMLGYFCPSLGVLMAMALYAAPAVALHKALRVGNLGPLNPIPWAIMSGNCVGWCAYASYTHDPFILASSLPGLRLSIWLNLGAAQLQYVQPVESQSDDEASVQPAGDERHGTIIMSNGAEGNGARSSKSSRLRQEVLFMIVLAIWAIILVCVGWVGPLRQYAIPTIGWFVNANLILFYAAPLQTMTAVISTGFSDSLHRPTVVLTCLNAMLWMTYGVAKNDVVMYTPNIIGLMLGIAQGIMLLRFPKKENSSP